MPDIKVYYKEGFSFVAIDENKFFKVSDDGQARSVVKELPPKPLETSENSDNQGQTGGHARSLIATACQVARAIKESEFLLAQTEKGA